MLRPRFALISICFFTLSFSSLALTSCRERVEVPAKKIRNTGDSSKDVRDPKTPVDGSDDPVVSGPDQKTLVPDPKVPDPEKPEVDTNTGEPAWSLISPAPGATSSDNTPVITGQGLSAMAGSLATIYEDSSCKSALGSTEIDAKGHVRIDSLRLPAQGSDGAKNFFVRIQKDKVAGECQDLKLSYTLKTNLPFAKSNYLRLSFTDDPSTKISVGFNASSSSKPDHKIYFDTEDHGRDVKSYMFSKPADVNRAMLGMNNAFVRLAGLKPDTTYYFVIEDPSGISPTYSFRTLPNTPDAKLSIIAGGDSRNNRTPRKNANLLVSKLRAHLVMFGGDMTNLGITSEWKEWFEDWQTTIAADGRVTPIIAQRGNHEAFNVILETLFDTPAGVYYAMNAGGSLLRIYTLNTEASITGTQTTWLKDDLKANTNAIWKFVQYHVPMRPHVKGKSEGSSQYSAWAQLFYDNRVTLVVESDSHTVKSTWPLKPSSAKTAVEGFERDDANGTTYIGEGCWGAPLRTADDAKVWTRDSGAFNHFNWITVTREKIEIKTIKVDNAPEVGKNTDQDIFRIPEKLDIWQPKNGDTITISKS